MAIVPSALTWVTELAVNSANGVSQSAISVLAGPTGKQSLPVINGGQSPVEQLQHEYLLERHAVVKSR